MADVTVRQEERKATASQCAEYVALRTMVFAIGILPRAWARAAGAGFGWIAWRFVKGLRKTGRRNLLLAFPEKTEAEREQILREMFRTLGWQMAEFCLMSRYTVNRASEFIRYEGLENYTAARDRGKGVLVLTGHLGAWELSSFYHSMRGMPMSLVIRRLDNPLVDRFVNDIRSLHGNRVIHKDDFARGLLTAMHHGETVGILMDTNMTPPQGVFVPFFGVDACTASGLARVALKTDAAVLPGFLLWHADEAKYVLHFGEELKLAKTGDAAADILANTALFAGTTEGYIRRYPEQWLWVHRRWKTRPEGEQGVY